ncbi:MAG: hypothetical protein JW804_06985 [Sedimentisphaerales bacterium]|nr:hypothetical protein [Sedimentisphaerales bacterium]
MRMLITVLFLTNLCFAEGCAAANATEEKVTVPSSAEDSKCEPIKVKPVDEVLAKLNESAKKIKTYQADIIHLSRQPLFESQTLRTGRIYYQRLPGQSLLRVDFNTLKQDDQPAEKYIEQFYFDGVWLTRIDFQLKEVKRYQLVDPNDIDAEKGVDAFDLISEHLPVVGFTGTDKLKKEFDITLIEPNQTSPANCAHLRMGVKADSKFKDDWEHIDCWVAKKQYLPVKMATYTTEDEIYELEFIEPKVNEPIDKSIFAPKVPEGFVLAEEKPLKKR